MADFSLLFRFVPVRVFTAVYLREQEFGEVDPVFANEFGERLGTTLKFFDSRGRSLDVCFNKGYLHPLLMGGWSQMPVVFYFDGDAMLTLFYYGDDLFGLAFKESVVCYSQLLVYHSRSQQFPHVALFGIHLTDEIVVQPYMNIYCHFEDFLRDLGEPYIIVFGDNGSITVFNVAFTSEPFKVTTLGLGWAEFCERNGFCSGDDICFKFNLLYRRGFAHVYKI